MSEGSIFIGATENFTSFSYSWTTSCSEKLTFEGLRVKERLMLVLLLESGECRSELFVVPIGKLLVDALILAELKEEAGLIVGVMVLPSISSKYNVLKISLFFSLFCMASISKKLSDSSESLEQEDRESSSFL